MGVRGLQRVVARHEDRASIRINLGDGVQPDGRRGLVFDGDGLVYYLQDRLLMQADVSTHSISGGCLYKLASATREFMGRFIAASIPVWVVFDGIQANSKSETRVLRRQRASSLAISVQEHLNNQCLVTDYTKKIVFSFLKGERLRAPELCKSTVAQTLRQLNILCSFALYEADHECVRLCAEVNALAIVAQDSDFLIFDQPAGYIPLSSIIFDDDGSILVRMFQAPYTARVLAVPVTFLPIIAGLVGNDAVVESSPQMKLFHKVLRRRSSHHAPIDQVLQAARDFHRRWPCRQAPAFLKHILDTTIPDATTIRELSRLVQSVGIPQYEPALPPNLDSALARLHCSARLSSTFALDVYLNRRVSLPFGVGYAMPEDVRFVANALAGLRCRISQVVMFHVDDPWTITEDSIGVDVLGKSESILTTHTGEFRARLRDIGCEPGVSIVDSCHAGVISGDIRIQLLQAVLFDNDEQRRFRCDTVFMNALRYMLEQCSGSAIIATALVMMYEQIGASWATSAPCDLTVLRSCAVFRHTFALAEMMNALLAWPLPESILFQCFDSDQFHQQLSALTTNYARLQSARRRNRRRHPG